MNRTISKRLPVKLCIVAIYRNGVLRRIVYEREPLEGAEQFCRHFNRLNRSTEFVAALQPLPVVKGGGS